MCDVAMRSCTGVGFAIGIDTVRRVVPQLIATGRVVRPALNIQVCLLLERRSFTEELLVHEVFVLARAGVMRMRARS